MTRDDYVRKSAERLRGLDATAGGHGHVRPRLDGIKARCGGPGLCAECAREAADQKRSDENRAVEIANDMYRRFAGLTGFRETAKAAYNAGREDAAREKSALIDALRRLRDSWYRQPGWTDAADTVDVLIDAFADDDDLPPGVHRENDGGLMMEPYGPPRDLADFGTPVLIAPPPGEGPLITPAVPSTVAAPVTYTAAEGFYEDDEPVADVAAAFDAADKGVTRRPKGAWSLPAEIQAEVTFTDQTRTSPILTIIGDDGRPLLSVARDGGVEASIADASAAAAVFVREVRRMLGDGGREARAGTAPDGGPVIFAGWMSLPPEIQAEGERAASTSTELCGDVYADGPPLSRHTCGRPSGHTGAHRCRCPGIESYTWPAEAEGTR